MNKLCEHLTRLYVRVCFNELRLASHHAHIIGGHNLNLESNLKARCFSKWLKYCVKSKLEAQKYNSIKIMHEKNHKRNLFYAWQNLHWVNIMVNIFKIGNKRYF